MTYKFSAERQVWSDSIAIRMAFVDKEKFSVATNVTMQEIKSGEYTEPFIRLSASEAQELANQLYAAGIKPEQAAGSAGQLDAVKYHLEDMRKLVFMPAIRSGKCD